MVERPAGRGQGAARPAAVYLRWAAGVFGLPAACSARRVRARRVPPEWDTRLHAVTCGEVSP